MEDHHARRVRCDHRYGCRNSYSYSRTAAGPAMHDAMHDAMHRYGCRNSYGCTRIQQLALCVYYKVKMGVLAPKWHIYYPGHSYNIYIIEVTSASVLTPSSGRYPWAYW
jgi:hypothetical protein